jgi:predicted acylesterase/phospholipase RssA/CRP-like cAMP-binding protein
MNVGLDPVEVMRSIGVFSRVPSGVAEQLTARSTTRRVSAGDWLFRAGEPSDEMFVILTGRLEVVAESPEGARRIRLLSAGDSVGELGVLTRADRLASVRALRDTELLCTPQDQIESLYDEIPGFASAMVQAVASHLRLDPPRPRATAYAVLVDERLPAEHIRRLLMASLTARCRAAVIDVVVPDGSGALEPLSLARQLDLSERENDVTLLFSSMVAAGESWVFCLRQVDSVVVVAPPGVVPRPELVELASAAHLERVEVAFVGPRLANPAMSAWLNQSFVTGRHQLGEENEWAETIDRLARSMLGQATGVVLSGGGARGFAHIGALEVFDKAGITIDRIGGTSMGAFIAALYATGVSPDEIVRICRKEMVEQNPFNDYTLPRVSVLRARRGELMLERIFGTASLEVTRIPCFTVSCDLATAEVVVHRRGPIAAAVGASMSIPGLVPPLASGGRFLVDGGVLNNLPVDQMPSGPGPVVAIDVMVEGWAPRTVRWETRPGRPGLRGHLELLVRRGPERVPRLAETLIRATVIGSWRMALENRLLADVLVSPAVGKTGLLDFRQIDELVELGRAAANDSLSTIRERMAARSLVRA